MASSSVLARVGLVSAVAVILGISTLSPLLKPAPDYGRTPVVSGPPLYQTAAALPAVPERATEARAKPVRLTSTAVALLGFPPPRPVANSSTTAVAPPPLPQQQPTHTAEAEALPPPPIVAEAESPPPKPEKRAAAPKRPKKARIQQPPIYTRAVQMSVY